MVQPSLSVMLCTSSWAETIQKTFSSKEFWFWEPHEVIYVPCNDLEILEEGYESDFRQMLFSSWY